MTISTVIRAFKQETSYNTQNQNILDKAQKHDNPNLFKIKAFAQKIFTFGKIDLNKQRNEMRKNEICYICLSLYISLPKEYKDLKKDDSELELYTNTSENYKILLITHILVIREISPSTINWFSEYGASKVLLEFTVQNHYADFRNVIEKQLPLDVQRIIALTNIHYNGYSILFNLTQFTQDWGNDTNCSLKEKARFISADDIGDTIEDFFKQNPETKKNVLDLLPSQNILDTVVECFKALNPDEKVKYLANNTTDMTKYIMNSNMNDCYYVDGYFEYGIITLFSVANFKPREEECV